MYRALDRLAVWIAQRSPAVARTFHELTAAREQLRTAEQEVRDLKAHSDATRAWGQSLERERDEVIAHGQRLQQERDEAWRHMEEASNLLPVVIKERDELKAHAVRLANERNELAAALGKTKARLAARDVLLWIEPGHFYSPIVDPRDASAVGNVWPNRLTESVAGIALDESAMHARLDAILRHASEFPFPQHRSPGFRFHVENPAFSYSDAYTCFSFLLELRPARIVEVGSGYSSALFFDLNDHFLSGSMPMTIIDPYPEVLRELVTPDDLSRCRLFEKPVQECGLELFEALGKNDILFIDSSHVAKTGSDVNDYLFRILPALKSGVVVHIHDILYPFEYPPDWQTPKARSWNEAYAVRAFLEYNSDFEILFFTDLMFNKARERVQHILPECLRNTGGSLWLRRR